MVDPGLSEAGKRVWIGMEEAVILEDQLTRTQVPPYIRIGNTAGRHGEQAESENRDEYPASLQETSHAQRDCMPRR